MDNCMEVQIKTRDILMPNKMIFLIILLSSLALVGCVDDHDICDQMHCVNRESTDDLIPGFNVGVEATQTDNLSIKYGEDQSVKMGGLTGDYENIDPNSIVCSLEGAPLSIDLTYEETSGACFLTYSDLYAQVSLMEPESFYVSFNYVHPDSGDTVSQSLPGIMIDIYTNPCSGISQTSNHTEPLLLNVDGEDIYAVCTVEQLKKIDDQGDAKKYVLFSDLNIVPSDFQNTGTDVYLFDLSHNILDGNGFSLLGGEDLVDNISFGAAINTISITRKITTGSLSNISLDSFHFKSDGFASLLTSEFVSGEITKINIRGHNSLEGTDVFRLFGIYSGTYTESDLANINNIKAFRSDTENPIELNAANASTSPTGTTTFLGEEIDLFLADENELNNISRNFSEEARIYE